MKGDQECRVNKYAPQGGALLAAIAGMILALFCLVTPVPAATFEEQLQEFLEGQPFEFTVGFPGQKIAICMSKFEGPLPILSLLYSAPKTGDPALERITEFAEEMQTDYL